MTRVHILLIEDNPADACLFRQMLSEAGHMPIELECVQRLRDGLSRQPVVGPARTDCANLILLDLSLPDSQGLDTLRAVRARFPESPIVVLTGLDDSTLAIDALREGAQDYLVKCQLDGASLVRSIRYAVERKRIEQELELHGAILATQLELCPDGILVVDPCGNIAHFNRRFAVLWQIPLEVMEPQPRDGAPQAFMNRLADSAPYFTPVAHLPAERVPKSRKEVALADGRTFEQHSAPMFGPAGKYYGRVWFFRDITGRKQSEQALAEQVRDLERFNNLAVGREQRMIQLKQEVNELSRQLGKPAPYDLDFLQQDGEQPPGGDPTGEVENERTL